MDPNIDVDRRQPRLRRLSTDELSADDIAVIRRLMVAAFGADEEEPFSTASMRSISSTASAGVKASR